MIGTLLGSDLASLFRREATSLRHRIEGVRYESKLKLAVLATFGAGIAVILYFLSREGLDAMHRNALFTEPVLGYVLSIFFFAITVMLTLSNGVLAYGSLFRSEESAFLMALPVKRRSLYTVVLVRTFALSSWAFVYFALPFLLAFGHERGAPAAYYGVTLAAIVPFVLVPAGLGTLLALLTAACLPRGRRVATAVAALLFLALFSWIAVGLLSAELRGRPFTGAWTQAVFTKIEFCRNAFLPSEWLSRLVLRAAKGDSAALPFLAILSTALVLVAAGREVSNLLHSGAWLRCRGHAGEGAGGRSRPARRGAFLAPLLASPFRQPLRALVAKDVRSFLRDPRQYAQFVIFFSLLALYFANLRSFSYDMKGDTFVALAAFLNFGAVSLTLASLTSRFFFPALSIETRRFWVLATAPIDRADLVRAKLAFGGLVSFLLAGALILLSDLMLAAPLRLMAFHGIALACLSVGLSGLATGLGALYPVPHEEEPAKIVSGFGGTLNLLLSLGLVLVTLLAMWVPTVSIVRGLSVPFLFSPPAAIAAIALVSLAAAAVPVALGSRRLRHLEV